MLGNVLGVLRRGLEALATWLRLRERSKNEKAGANQERLKQIDEVEHARKAMGDVPAPDPRSLIDRLRGHKF